MGPLMAVYGKPALDLKTFTKAFVAGLVMRDMYEVRPGDTATRRGFEGVVEVLDQAREAIKSQGGDKAVIRMLGRLANELRSSNTGAFDGFEAALRQVQLTFTASPNPDYDDIVFSVPKSYAEAEVSGLEPAQRKLVDSAVEIFVEQVGWH